MSQDEPQNSQDRYNPSPVLGEIPSAVTQATTPPYMTWLLLGLGAIIVGFVALSPRKKSAPAAVTPSTLPESSLGSAIQPSLLNLPPARAVQVQSAPIAYSSPSEGESRLQARLQSPMVIFNGSNGGQGLSLGLKALSGSGNTGDNATAPSSSGVPLPPHFTPTTTSSSHSGNLGDREFVISEGKLLDAVLESAINSDHPGMIRGIVSNDIYGDSGRTVLLPKGSRLIGQYDSDVQQGQSRIFILWQRAIRPDGIDILLGSAGTDALGQTGIEGSVNHHFFMMFGAATLLSVMGAAASNIGVSPLDQPNSAAAYREAITQGFANSSSNILNEFVRIKPTITIRPGMPVKVFVARDLYFDQAALAQTAGIEVVQ